MLRSSSRGRALEYELTPPPSPNSSVLSLAASSSSEEDVVKDRSPPVTGGGGGGLRRSLVRLALAGTGFAALSVAGYRAAEPVGLPTATAGSSSTTPSGSEEGAFAADGEEAGRVLSLADGSSGGESSTASWPRPLSSMNPEVSPDTEGAAERIILLGERHSGTNWINDHLEDCFADQIAVTNEYSRFKHWFQDDKPGIYKPKSSIVLVLFRDPIDWVNALREEPHHAHYHLMWKPPGIVYNQAWHEHAHPMHWKSFVTRAWHGHRSNRDYEIMRENRQNEMHEKCVDRFSFGETIPCSKEDSDEMFVVGLGPYKYEQNRDGSGRAYSSVIDLRRDKIVNHLSVADYEGTRAFYPLRYEDLKAGGTEELIAEMERVTGLTRGANCTPFEGSGPAAFNAEESRRRLRTGKDNPLHEHKELPDGFVDWMNKYHDWEVEGRLGYSRRED